MTRIKSHTVKSEIRRRADDVRISLGLLKEETLVNLEWTWERLQKSLGNIAKEVQDFTPKKEDKDKDKDKDEKKKDKDGKDKKDPGEKDDASKEDSNKTNEKDDVDKKDGKEKKEKNDEGDKKKEAEKANPITDLLETTLLKGASEALDLGWEGITSIPDADGKAIDKMLIVGQIESTVGDLSQVIQNNEAKMVFDPNTNEIEVAEKQDKLLTTSQEQIDKFVKDLGKSKLGPRVLEVQKALKDYIDLVAKRNADKVQYNVALKDLITNDKALKAADIRHTELQRDASSKPGLDQLSQFTQMAEEIYSWSRKRTMRLLSFYRRALYIAKLEPPGNYETGDQTSDAALTLPAAKLEDIHNKLKADLFHLRDKAGSDAAPYPEDFAHGRGKRVHLSTEQLAILMKHKQIQVTLPAPGQQSRDPAMSMFWGCADVRVSRVRFFLKGLKIREGVPREDVAIRIGLTHEGDSVYYDQSGLAHTFKHDVIPVSWSYRPLVNPRDGGRDYEAVDSGDIVLTDSRIMNYAAPSPFATWTITLDSLDEAALDPEAVVTQGTFEFFGTSRAFRPI